MKITYEIQGSETYLVCEMGNAEELDSIAVGMLTNNRINGIVPAIFTRMDNNHYLKYNVTGKAKATVCLAGVLPKKRLLDFLQSICTIIIEAPDYMLDATKLVWDLEYIYVNAQTLKAEMIYLPITAGNGEFSDMVAFLRNLITTVQYDHTEDASYIGEIISCLNSATGFSTKLFKEVLNRAKADKNSPPPVAVATTEQPVQIEQQAKPTPIIPATPTTPSIPNIPAMPNATPKPAPVPEILQQEQITLLQLLSSYNKERATLYKAQKAAKKEMAQQAKLAKKEEAKNKKKPKKLDKIQPPTAVPENYVASSALSEPPQPPTPIPTPPPMPIPTPTPMPQEPQATSVEPANQQIDFNETVYMNLDEYEGTVLLEEPPSQQDFPYLIRQRNEERIPINKPLFKFGRLSTYSDYVMADNKHIGSLHCHVISKNGEYFIVDDNSKNHTFTNGTRIVGSVEVKIDHGTKIKMADEEFEFMLS